MNEDYSALSQQISAMSDILQSRIHSISDVLASVNTKQEVMAERLKHFQESQEHTAKEVSDLKQYIKELEDKLEESEKRNAEKYVHVDSLRPIKTTLWTVVATVLSAAIIGGAILLVDIKASQVAGREITSSVQHKN